MQPGLSFLVGNWPSVVVLLGFAYFLTVRKPLIYLSVPKNISNSDEQLAYGVRKNPLSSLPGPQLTKWTDLLVKYYTVTGQRPRYVHSLHQKYGNPSFLSLRRE
jgi:hypothetical protein